MIHIWIEGGLLFWESRRFSNTRNDTFVSDLKKEKIKIEREKKGMREREKLLKLDVTTGQIFQFRSNNQIPFENSWKLFREINKIWLRFFSQPKKEKKKWGGEENCGFYWNTRTRSDFFSLFLFFFFFT